MNVQQINSPDSKSVIESFTKKLDNANSPTRVKMFSAAKQIMRNKQQQQEVLTSSNVPSATEPIDVDDFNYYHPSWRKGRHRGECNIHNPTYKFQYTVIKARQMAVKNKRTTILAAGNHDQITLALLKTLNHPYIRPFFHRIVGSRNSEAMNVGLQAVRGMKPLVDRVAENQGSGG